MPVKGLEEHTPRGRRLQPTRSGPARPGGIRTSKQALHYLVMVKETLGDEWLTPSLFRFGASSLANDLLMQLAKLRTGTYMSPDDFTAS